MEPVDVLNSVQVPTKILQVNGKNPKNNNLDQEISQIHHRQNINIFHQNIQSLRNKKVNLEILIQNSLHDVDIIGLTEHWLNENEMDYYNLPRYTLISKYCRRTKNNGGSCIFVKNSIKAKMVKLFDNLMQDEHFEASLVELVDLKLVVICIYRNPSSNIQILINSLDIILTHLYGQQKSIVIVGDLNVNFIADSPIKQQLCDFLWTHNLEAVVNCPTRVTHKSESAIDQLILDSTIFSFNIEIINTALSDHYGQKYVINTNKIKVKDNVIYKFKRIVNEENINYLKFLLSKEDWENIYSQNNIDATFEEFVHTFSHYMNIAMPLKKIRVRLNENVTSEWITKGIRISSIKLKALTHSGLTASYARTAVKIFPDVQRAMLAVTYENAL